MSEHPHKVQVLLEFWADMPDDDLAADMAADRIGDDLVEELEKHVPDGILPQTFAIVDWTDVTPRDGSSR